MPRLSDTMTTGTVATWLKKVGDSIKEGDIIAEIETDKATMEFESFNAGTLLYIGVEEGGSAPVDSILAILGPEGTDVSGVVANFKADGSQETPKTESIVEVKTESIALSNSISTSSSGRIFASPLAKKIAQDKGINLAQVKGTGENGRITKADVEGFNPISVSPAQAIADATSSVASVKPFVPAGKFIKRKSKIRKCVKPLREDCLNLNLLLPIII